MVLWSCIWSLQEVVSAIEATSQSNQMQILLMGGGKVGGGAASVAASLAQHLGHLPPSDPPLRIWETINGLLDMPGKILGQIKWDAYEH